MAKYFLRFAVIGLVGTATSAPAEPPRPNGVDTLLNCLDVPAPDQRLACFETRARDLRKATERKDVIVLDQVDIAKTRRSLFGFSLPPIPWFNGVKDKSKATSESDRKVPAEDLTRLETTIKSATRTGNGGWALILADDARWETVEPGRDADVIRPGMPIKIRRASMGTYFATIGSYIFLRVHRVS